MTKFHSFLRLSSIPVCVNIIFSLSIHLPMDTGCLHILALVNNAAMNIGVHASFQISGFVLFEYIPWSRTARSYGSSIFSLLRNCHVVFRSGCMHQLMFPPTGHGVTFLHILADIGYLWSFCCSHSDRYLTVVLICTYLMINDVEHLFLCLSAIYISSLEKYLFRCSAHFLIEWFVLTEQVSTVYICGILISIDHIICKYILPFS